MTKIFRSILLLLSITTIFSLFGCFTNEYVEMENGVDITVSRNIQPYFLHQDSLPVLHFDYNGVRIMEETSGSSCYFVQNDQYILSDKFLEHLKTYDRENIYIISQIAQEKESKEARIGKDKLVLDKYDEEGNEQLCSVEYQIVCVNNDGTRYSYQFRSFVSNGKRYFCYRYSSNMAVSLEQPLMVVKSTSNKNSLLLLPLPFDTYYEVSGNNINLKSLIEKDTYLDEKYYKFQYPNYLKDLSEEEKVMKIKEWYNEFCDGYTNDEGEFIISYLNATFRVDFGLTDCGNTRNSKGFKLTFIG